MKKFMIIAPKNKTLYNFRGELIKDIIKKGYNVIAIGPNKDNIQEVLNLGVSFIEVNLKKDKVSIFSDIEYYRSLKKVIKKEKPDIVFSYTIKPVIYGSIAAKRVGTKKIYAMVTGLGRVFASHSIKAKIVKFISSLLYKYAFICCDKVIFQNEDDINELTMAKIIAKDKAIKVNGSGVNMEKFVYVDNPLNDSFLMVSRIIKEKGVLEYLKAAEIVKRKYPKATFTLLGGYDNSIGALTYDDIKYYLDNEIVNIPGETNNVVPYYDNHMCFILPSYYKEGLPRTILESLAIGRPVITTDWTGCRDAIEDNVNGFLVPIRDYNILAEKMIWMIENHDKVRIMSKRNNEKCKKIYDVKIINKEMLKIMGI